AGSVFVGTNGAIKGSLSAADAEIKGLLSESAVIKGFLHLRSTGRVAGKVSCGDLEVERGAGNSPEPHAAAGGSAEGAVAQAMPEIPSGLEAPNGANGSAAASL
ncbi:MAG: polymer-forming cytoskeletal protein, partial [Methyloceanibacter sp.]